MNGQIIRKDSPLNVQNSNDDMYGFRLILFSDTDEMHELWLPAMPEGFFRFTDNHEHRFLSIVSQNGQWVAVCKKPAFFQNVPWEQSCEVPLADRQLLQIDCSDRVYYLYVENVYKRHMAYKYCYANTDVEINIGSKSGSEIYYDNPYIAARHAVLRRISGRWSVQDCGSVFGVFVNRIKKVSGYLKTGDIVSIMGLRIIIGPNFLSVNDYAGGMTINSEILQSIDACHSGYSYYHDQEFNCQGDSYFNRLPRKRLEIAQRTISVEGPPMSIDQKQIPMILRMGSSMVMGGAAALAGNFMTLISSVMFPFLSSKYTEKQRQEYEQLRLYKYREYLSKKAKEIEIACQEEKKLLNQKYPENGTVIETVKQKTHLWERRPVDSDFLEIRLGTGTRKLTATLEYPVRRFELESDVLEEEMYQLVEQPRYIDDVPIVLPIADTRVCGLLGSRDQVISYIRQMVLQISAFHSYDEVKTVFFLNDQELEKLDEFRYLPHAWDDQRTIRYIATEEADAYKLGEHIKDQIARDKEGEQNLSKILKKRPYYLIFALDKKLFECHEVMKEIMQSGETYGISIFTAYDDLPKESQKIITLESDKKNTCTTMGVDGGKDVRFCTDYYDENEYSQAMRILANTRLKTGAQAQELPKMVTFLEMFNAGRVEQLNPLKRWQDSNPVKSLAAPVGIGTDGTLFTLDLHEKRQGPHGLIAGMTGSGKSEFIITYILSMAVNYHPDEVAFVLIDYKGGGLAGAFENPQTGVKLPHLVGTITNLDGASIQRSLMSIESELIRRQRIFNDVKSTVNEGTMDIYAYQKLYRAGRVSEPMPHLFIVSDEFAELKQQQPEFMDKLISAARIGRSLGVHLILATQKPSGVVNDQIRSNTKFRVCLRVQDRSDSMDMLKRPEAAELTDTGRFYLQVGYNEYFAMGQSAWCGAQYEPQDTVIVQKDDAVEFLDTAGQVIVKAKPKVKKTDSGMKQIVAIVKYLSDLAKTHGIQAKQLWLEPLEEVIELNDLQKTDEETSQSKVCVTIGTIDDPEKQRKYSLSLDILKGQHYLIIGNAGSGKTTLIKTVLLELTRKYAPDKLNYYIVDCSGGTLGVFKKAPHCGAFLTENDETDMERFLGMLRSWIAERKAMFGQAGVTSYEAYCHVSPIPLILVVFDNFSGFTSMSNGNTYFATFHELLKETPNLGIRIMVSCNNLNELSMRSKQEINNRIALQMKDRFAYSEVLNCRCLIEPAANPGRGLCQIDGRVLEYQVAIPFVDQNEQARTFAILEEIAIITQRDFSGKTARKLPVVIEDETYEAFCKDIPTGRLPLGYELKNASKISMPLAQMFRICVYLGNPDGVVPILKNIQFAVQKNSGHIILVKRSVDSVFDKMPDLAEGIREADIYDSSSESSLKLCELLISEVLHRKTFRDMYCDENGIPAEKRMQPTVLKKASGCIRSHTTPLFLLVEDFCEFSANMTSTATDFFENIFKNGKGYNFYFISCFYPESRNKLAADMLVKQYAEESPMLFFGGQFQSQALTTLPTEYRSINSIQKKYNRFLMRYDGNFYPLVMPCGILQMEEADPDELPILS